MVLAIAAVALLLGKGQVERMLHRTRSIGWHTPEGSPSLAAEANVKHYFPGRMRGAVVMGVEAQEGTPSVLTDVVAEFSRNVSSRIAEDSRVSPFAPIVVGHYLNVMGHRAPRGLLKELVSKDERTTVIIIQPTRAGGNWHDASAFLQEFCSAPPPGYTLHITGIVPVLAGDGCFQGVHAKVNTVDMNFEALTVSELCTFPLALLIMARIVRRPRLLLVPPFVLLVSFVACAAVMVPWMELVAVPRDAPAAMGSVTMALCLDYSLFILSRFSENRAEGLTLQQNVDSIQGQTCRTITVSATLIAVALFGSMIMPEQNMRGTGFGLGVATLACVGVSTIFTPAILIVGGAFFAGKGGTPAHFGDVQLEGCLEEPSSSTKPPQRSESAFWLHVMRLVERTPLAAMAFVLVAMTPLLWQLPGLNITGDQFAMLPMHMPAMMALRRLQGDFPLGILEPYAIVVTAPSKSGAVLELKAGVKSLEAHNAKEVAVQLGLSAEEAKTLDSIAKSVDPAQLHSVAVVGKRADTAPVAATKAAQLVAANVSHALSLNRSSAPELPLALGGANLGSSPARPPRLPSAEQATAAKAVNASIAKPLQLVGSLASATEQEHGTLLMPSGYAAMLDLCARLQSLDSVSSMLGHTWAYHQPIDWPTAVLLSLNSSVRQVYQPLLESHVNGRRALLEVHTRFPSIGAGGAEWVLTVRELLQQWEAAHPGYTAELSGGASEAADTRAEILEKQWSYLGVSVSVIMVVVYGSFRSLMISVRLVIALLFTLGATYGFAGVVYQTPLLHGVFPSLAYFDGVSYEVVPVVTGVVIALGLDYDIFLVSRIVEFRLRRCSDRASIFRGVLKTGEVISGAGLIMALAFTGLVFSDKLIFQQFGVILIASVLFDTFVVRTVLVPALMLIAKEWNWWPRSMPPAKYDVLEGDLTNPILGGTSLEELQQDTCRTERWAGVSGMIA